MSYVLFALALLVCTVMSAHGQMVGGPTKQDPSDPEHMVRAWKAAKGVNDNASNAGPYHMIPIKILQKLRTKSSVFVGLTF
ncbi:hypothetical protein RB195_016141 [Necator americanus]|uniref:Uncharacterized protein n=1 Tax=Necator americanus TaxID=51031 RepID=A0ABR1E7S4_NECAM